jgi:alpha-L-fucosidase
MDLYYKSVGRGASLHLNLPPDPRGRIHESDLESLTTWNRRRRRIFDADLAEGASVTASNTRKGTTGDRPFAAANVRDGNPSTYWATDDEVCEAELTLSFAAPREINVVEIREHIALGQRVDGVTVDALVDGIWRSFGRCESVGYRRLLTGEPCTAEGVRLRIHGAAAPTIEHVAAYRDVAETHS